MGLSREEKKQFVELGYVVRRIPLDADVVRRAIDLTWEHLDPRFIRDIPQTWRGEIQDSCRVATIEHRRGRVKLRECVNRTPWLMDLIYANPELRAVIADLLGPTGGPRRTIRGLYPNFPSRQGRAPVLGGMDGHPFQVGCVMYLSDVAPSGGGFTLWEGSHRTMRFAFDGHASWKLNDRLDTLRTEAMARCRNVELVGPVGTTVLWHHRLLHTPSTNLGAEIRHAVVADFVQAGWERRQDEPRHPDMWDGWAVGEADRQLTRLPDRLSWAVRRLATRADDARRAMLKRAWPGGVRRA